MRRPLALVFSLLCALNLALAPSMAQAGAMMTRETTVMLQPTFYKGPMPLKFREGMQMLGMMGMDLVMWRDFGDMRHEYAYTSVLILESAKATDRNGRKVAEATFVNLDKESHRIIFRERHFDASGSVIFECISAYGVGFGMKLTETPIKGKKERDYFFLLPV